MVKEQELIQEIQYYKDQIGKTQSKQRQWQLYRHIYKLEKELKIAKKCIKILYK